jgi:hypothetical protein
VLASTVGDICLKDIFSFAVLLIGKRNKIILKTECCGSHGNPNYLGGRDPED